MIRLSSLGFCIYLQSLSLQAKYSSEIEGMFSKLSSYVIVYAKK